MTHTLHRYGKREDLTDDFIVTVMPARGINDQHAVEKQKAFLRAALKHGPVNIGDSSNGAEYKPSKELHPTVHWHRDSSPDPEAVIAKVDTPTTVSAVFDNFEAVKAFVADLKELDLGLSVNIASIPEKAVECCHACGLTRHSVEYSLGFHGRTEKLPDDASLQLMTMCGHGMISATFARKMLDWVRTGRRTAQEASRCMARFCVCGSFNPARAVQILNKGGEGRR
jgi:hypothetical protein